MSNLCAGSRDEEIEATGLEKGINTRLSGKGEGQLSVLREGYQKNGIIIRVLEYYVV